MVITDLPMCRKNSAVHATTSAAVFSPPTTSTSGMRYGGLNGWATTSRCGDRASTAISVIPKPEVDEAMTTCSGVAASIAASSRA